MTVRELIEALQQQDPNERVTIATANGERYIKRVMRRTDYHRADCLSKKPVVQIQLEK